LGKRFKEIPPVGESYSLKGEMNSNLIFRRRFAEKRVERGVTFYRFVWLPCWGLAGGQMSYERKREIEEGEEGRKKVIGSGARWLR